MVGPTSIGAFVMSTSARSLNWWYMLGQLLLDVLRRLVGDVEQHAAVRRAAAFLHLGVDRARDEVARRKLHALGVVALHEALVLRVACSRPPSPRTASVTRMPFTPGGHTMPVGWNWTNSMSINSAPARNASAWPSAVYSHEFDVTRNIFPMPPVAMHDRLGLEHDELAGLAPVAERARRRARRPSSSSTIGAFHEYVDALVDAAVLQGADHLEAGAVADVREALVGVTAKRALAGFSRSGVRSKTAPQRSSSRTRSGASCACSCCHAPVVHVLAAAAWCRGSASASCRLCRRWPAPPPCRLRP